MPWKPVLIVAGLVALGGVVTLTLLSLLSRRPNNLGPRDGRLPPCPDSSNCVCSQDNDEPHAIAPFAFEGSPEEAMKRLRAVLDSWPRTTIVTDADGYLYAECRTLLFRFIDDVEFLLDGQAKVIHVRAAARIGKTDLGVNRRRVEALRQAFANRAAN